MTADEEGTETGSGGIGEDQAARPDGPGLLAGVRVLDLSIWRPGPYATQLLSEIGAEVLKVEPPGGDPMRLYADLFTGLHANKRSVMLDLKTAGDRARAIDLARQADVVIEGFRPGVAARLGVAYEDVRQVNPEIVYCSLSGMGQSGRLADAPGHDLNYTAWAGVLAPGGGTPREPAIPVADLAGGMAAAFAICAALVRRARTGEGERIDVAMTDVLATWTGVAAPIATGVAGQGGVPGYGVFETADGGYVTLGIVTEDHFWQSLCLVLDLIDEATLDFSSRATQLEALQAVLADRIRERGRDDLVDELLAAGVPVAPVLDRAALTQLDHFRQRAVVTADPWADPATGYPVRFERHPARRTSPPPALDEHRGAGWD
jgi:crotonobetainyl-CoA:carnitine CoA-transferase CaiB-like acyl-CoA transferase